MKRLWGWLKSLFRTKAATTVEAKESPDESVELVGRWRLTDLLEQLPKYHRALRKNRAKYRDELGPIFNMGPFIFPTKDSQWAVGGLLNEKMTLPSMFFLGSIADRTETAGLPDMLAAVKINWRPGIQKCEGDLYAFNLYLESHDNPDISTWVGGCFYVHEGKITIPFEISRSSHRITRNGKRPKYVPVTEICKPLARSLDGLHDGSSGEEKLRRLAFAGFNMWNERDKYWLAVTKNKGCRVSFPVREGDHKYFFRDRDKTATTPTGKRKTIFHVVDEHERKTAKGVTIVKEHTRGVRHFFWKGTESHIFAPGWHGTDLFKRFDAELLDDDGAEEAKHKSPDLELVEASGVVEKMARVVEGTSIRHKLQIRNH